MSQHNFRVDPTTMCRVGWDEPLQTFFGQVFRVDENGEQIEEDDEGNDATILWVGTKCAEIRTVDELARLLKPHAELPAEVRKELFAIEVD